MQAASDADFWHPNPAFDKPVYENRAFEKDSHGAGFGAKLGGVFGMGKFTKSVISDTYALHCYWPQHACCQDDVRSCAGCAVERGVLKMLSCALIVEALITCGDCRDSKESARGMTTIDLHAESPREERCLTPPAVLGRSVHC